MEAVLEKPKGKKKVEADAVKEHIEKQLALFDGMMERHEVLCIDAFMEKGDLIAGKDHAAEEAGFKIVNHALESAFFVPLNLIVKATQAEIKALVIALNDGVFGRLHGVTRIVGYYSRINNWNKSKIGELRDRHLGDYKVT